MAIRPQRKNANRHTQRGMGLLESSIRRTAGLARSPRPPTARRSTARPASKLPRAWRCLTIRSSLIATARARSWYAALIFQTPTIRARSDRPIRKPRHALAIGFDGAPEVTDKAIGVVDRACWYVIGTGEKYSSRTAKRLDIVLDFAKPRPHPRRNARLTTEPRKRCEKIIDLAFGIVYLSVS